MKVQNQNPRGNHHDNYLDDALNYLLSCTPPKIEINHLKRCDGKFGRQKKVYCVAKLAKLAKLEETRGFAGINLGCELS